MKTGQLPGNSHLWLQSCDPPPYWAIFSTDQDQGQTHTLYWTRRTPRSSTWSGPFKGTEAPFDGEKERGSNKNSGRRSFRDEESAFRGESLGISGGAIGGRGEDSLSSSRDDRISSNGGRGGTTIAFTFWSMGDSGSKRGINIRDVTQFWRWQPNMLHLNSSF